MTEQSDLPDSNWRIFIAAWPDEAFLDSLAPVDRWINRFNSHRIIPREQRHLTVAFLGDVARDQIDVLHDAISAVTARLTPFESRASGVAGLPSERTPRVIAIELAPTPALAQMMRVVLEGVAKCCPTDTVLRDLDRDPRPHVTVARTRRSERARRLDFGKAPAIQSIFRFGEVCLVRSILKPTGPLYEIIRRAPLGDDSM